MQDVAAQYAVLSLGVACFQWGSCDRSAVDCRVEVFNVWLMCQEPYMIDPSSASFLLQHGFDFNKQFAKGLPYNPTITEVMCTQSTLPAEPVYRYSRMSPPAASR